jgi:hypothetical protein
MIKAMIIKELRDCQRIALVALAAYLFITVRLIDEDWSRGGWSPVPFVMDNFLSWFVTISLAFAIALGLGQTLGESVAGTYPLLLHRAATRRWLFGMKLLVGVTLYLVCAAVPILLYACWAATPGTHASPFFWSMTVTTWKIWLAMPLIYLGAFLSGVRPGRWWLSRLWPLAGLSLVVVLAVGTWAWPLVGPPLLAIAALLSIMSILLVVHTRDF